MLHVYGLTLRSDTRCRGRRKTTQVGYNTYKDRLQDNQPIILHPIYQKKFTTKLTKLKSATFQKKSQANMNNKYASDTRDLYVENPFGVKDKNHGTCRSPPFFFSYYAN